MTKKKYKRFPILLNKTSAMCITILSGYDTLEDIWTHMDEAVEEQMNTDYSMSRKAASQLLDQLEEHYCTEFLIQLAIGCVKRIKDMDVEFGSSQAKHSIKQILDAN